MNWLNFNDRALKFSVGVTFIPRNKNKTFAICVSRVILSVKKAA